HVGEQPRILRRVDAVDPVVRAHDRPGLRLLDDPLEPAQVDLAQGARVDVGAHPHPIVLLVVRGEVLERRAHALRLDAAHERGAQHPRDDGVFGPVLEIAAAQRGALDVDAGSEQHADLLDRGLDAEGAADPLDQLGIPRRAEPRRRREAGRRDALADAEVIASATLLAQAVRSVRHPDRRDAGALHRGGVPEVPAAGQRRLLFEGEPAHIAARHEGTICRWVFGSQGAWFTSPMGQSGSGSRGSYAKGVAKREEILTRALEVIAREGYRRASVKELAESVGLSQAGLLHYFGTKDELFVDILRKRDEVDA